MGAFYLFPKNSGTLLMEAKGLFIEKGFRNSVEFQLGTYTLLLYSKITLEKPNYINSNTGFIGSVGTFIYKDKFDKNALSLFFEDFITNNISPNEVIGSFCIIIYHKNKLYIVNDDENLYPVYFHNGLQSISSSFLALCYASSKLTIDRLSVIENLVTGCSLGFNTYFKEINRIRWGQKVKLPYNISSFSLSKRINNHNKLEEPSKELYYKLSLSIENYFKRIISIANKYACEVGLSSGFDSRLLLSLVLKFFNYEKLNLSTNFKKTPDTDIIIARKLAESIKKELLEIPVTPTGEMSSEQLKKNIHNSFIFYDGQFRVNHGWTREYRTSKYRKQVLNGASFGMSGHAGELFRNDYNLDSGKFSSHKYLKNVLIGFGGFKKINNNNDQNELMLSLKKKINSVLGSSNKDVYWDRNKAHQFYNEIWVPAGPGIRVSIENQLSYYISPFTDYLISKKTYSLAPHLKDATFEKSLISHFNKTISTIPYERKGRNRLSPVVYTTILYRFGFDFNYLLRKLKRKNKIIEKTISNLPYISNILSNPRLTQIIPLDRFLMYSISEPELDRIIAFSYVLNFFGDKIETS